VQRHSLRRPPAHPQALRRPPAIARFAVVVAAAALLLVAGSFAAACGDATAEDGDGAKAPAGRHQVEVPYWYLTCVDFVDARNGWAVGGVGGVLVRAGVVFVTHDGGATWKRQPVPLHLALRGVDFVTPRLGFAVGCDGAIIRTTDGRRWHDVRSGTTNSLYAVEFLDERNGWAVGDGVLLRTADGGQTWRQAPHPAPGVQFADVSFADALHGWVVGGSISSHGNWGATALVTSDGGESWFEQEVPTVQALYAVHFVDPATGWIVGNHGVLLHTDSGGARWEVQRQADDDGPGFLRGVHFTDTRHGWAVGGRGKASQIPVVLHTEDGGRRWKRVIVRGQTFFTWVKALDGKRAWVVGNHYDLARSTEDGSWSKSMVAPPPGNPSATAARHIWLQKLMSASHILL
jgi:photosystem II stability/assembly factor-like uncharacterized protein